MTSITTVDMNCVLERMRRNISTPSVLAGNLLLGDRAFVHPLERHGTASKLDLVFTRLYNAGIGNPVPSGKDLATQTMTFAQNLKFDLSAFR